MANWHQWIGVLGTVMIIGTYLLLQIGRLSNTSLSYSLFNALGAMLLVFSLLFVFNLGALIVEAFWVLISFIGIIRYFRIRGDGVNKARCGRN